MAASRRYVLPVPSLDDIDLAGPDHAAGGARSSERPRFLSVRWIQSDKGRPTPREGDIPRQTKGNFRLGSRPHVAPTSGLQGSNSSRLLHDYGS